jgi:hypothetical protein
LDPAGLAFFPASVVIFVLWVDSRPVIQSRVNSIVVWFPAMVATGWGVYHLALRIYAPPHHVDLPNWLLLVVGLCILAYGFGGLTCLLVNWSRATPLLRRRLHVLTFGTIGGWSLGLLFLAGIFLAPLTSEGLFWWFVSRPFKLTALGLVVLVPISLAWALFRDRVLELDSEQ